MRVVRAKTAGFCMGVSLALRRLDEALVKHRAGTFGRLVTLGPVIHNPRVIADYAAQGVFCIEDPRDISKDDTVLIRAHGIPKEIEANLLQRGVRLIDATCPKVKRAQLAISREYARGGTLLLYGEFDHPEVQGLVSYAGHQAHVFADSAALKKIELAAEGSFFLAAQTTQDVAGFEAICEQVEIRLGHVVPILKTICNATRKRQAEVVALAHKVTIVVVVGGVNSGNTRRLAEVAETQGVRAIHVENVSELDPLFFENAQVVALTAGASTPASHIDAVEDWLKKL